ncbi:MAG: LamG domain-containing protein, partial [Acidobacteriota bacterium]
LDAATIATATTTTEVERLALDAQLVRQTLRFNTRGRFGPEGRAGGQLDLTGLVQPFAEPLVVEISEGRATELDLAALTGDPAQASSITGTFTLDARGTDPQAMLLDLEARLDDTRYGTTAVPSADFFATLADGLLAFDGEGDFADAGRVALRGETEPFADGGVPGGRVITGGAWYPADPGPGAFPEAYRGSYFIALWGSNGGDAGDIHRVRGLDDPTVETFATDVRIGDAKPVLTRVDPLSGDLFYMLTTYQTGDGSVHRIRYTGATECSAGPGTPPVAHWRFDDGAGAQAADSAGAGAPDGLLVGAAWSADATDGSAGSIEFDGVDDRVELGTYDLGAGPVSLLFWFRADDFDTMDARFLSKATGVQEDDHFWMVSTLATSGTHRLRFRLKTDSVTSTLVASGGDLSPGVWYHAAAVYDGQAMRLYLNGVAVGSMSKTGA